MFSIYILILCTYIHRVVDTGGAGGASPPPPFSVAKIFSFLKLEKTKGATKKEGERAAKKVMSLTQILLCTFFL